MPPCVFDFKMGAPAYAGAVGRMAKVRGRPLSIATGPYPNYPCSSGRSGEADKVQRGAPLSLTAGPDQLLAFVGAVGGGPFILSL